MMKLLLPLAVVAFSAAAAQAQQAAPAPAAKEAKLPPRPALATDNQLLEFGSFEFPHVKDRTPKAKGGNPLVLSGSEWSLFDQPPNKEGGSITVGLTNEVARTGHQAIYVEFTKLTKLNAIATLATQFIHIKPGTPYRAAIWGQMDKKQALTIAQRIPVLRLQVDFFNEDLEEQVDQQFAVQQLPGSRNRPPLFVPNRWNEFYLDVTAPAQAHYIKLTWQWVSTNEAGETNGVLYFDDASLIGEAVEEPEETDTPNPALMKRTEGDAVPAMLDFDPVTGKPVAPAEATSPTGEMPKPAPETPMPPAQVPAAAPASTPPPRAAATPKPAESKGKATPAKKK